MGRIDWTGEAVTVTRRKRNLAMKIVTLCVAIGLIVMAIFTVAAFAFPGNTLQVRRDAQPATWVAPVRKPD